MDTLKELSEQRDKIDKQIADQREILVTNEATMDSPLVDQEGFPLSNIDVYSVRHARVEIIRLLNDRKAIEARIMAEMENAHQASLKGDKENKPTSLDEHPLVHRTSNTPFLLVVDLISGSPAYVDGLQTGDLIIQWGAIHHDVFSGIKEIVESANLNENKPVRVTALRDGRPIRLEVRPRRWDGSGLLGCKLQSLKS